MAEEKIINLSDTDADGNWLEQDRREKERQSILGAVARTYVERRNKRFDKAQQPADL